MKPLPAALLIILCAVAGLAAYGWRAAADRDATVARIVPAPPENLERCKRIVAAADAGDTSEAEVTFGKYAAEGLENCRTLIALYETEARGN